MAVPKKKRSSYKRGCCKSTLVTKNWQYCKNEYTCNEVLTHNMRYCRKCSC